jgi:hypothetical protein
MTKHPACCKSPETCTLRYVDHLRGFVLGVAAIPSRAVHRTPGQPDESATATSAREKRWAKDLPAFKALRGQGYHPRSVEGCDRLSATAKTDGQIEGRSA